MKSKRFTRKRNKRGGIIYGTRRKRNSPTTKFAFSTPNETRAALTIVKSLPMCCTYSTLPIVSLYKTFLLYIY